ncbi:MAG: DUF4124 domain-containing protein [Gammaproteobacteria bacterium]|nr:DUF4124 domain-containing protein [Gammaproteobacteria bacterium]MCI0591788.1 DUF4124 domain-containing protein [Gammaproteobacteria bacterium]
MKLVIVMVLLAGIVVAYLYFHPELADHWLRQTKETLNSAPNVGRPETTVLYKWKDKDGQWQISDQLPPPGTPFETLEYRHDLNILPVPPELQGKE